MKKPCVSILVPVYNAERFLAESLDSLLSQTFGDFEVIAVDDGSTDGSATILQSYALRDSRVRVISRANTGIAGALNDALAAARGAVVARMDADDISVPDRLERQIAFLNEHTDVVLLGSAYSVISEDGREVGVRSNPVDHEEIVRRLMLGERVVCHGTIAVPRLALEQVRGWRTEFVPLEDLDLCLRLAEIGRVANLADPLYTYRTIHRSLSHVSAQRQRREYRLRKAVLVDAFARQGKRMPPRWPIYRTSGYAAVCAACSEAISNRERLRALLLAVRACAQRPFTRRSVKLLARTASVMLSPERG